MPNPSKKAKNLKNVFSRMSRKRQQHFANIRKVRYTVKNPVKSAPAAASRKKAPKTKNRPVVPNAAALNPSRILPPGFKRIRKLTEKAAAAASSKKSPKLFKKSTNPLNMGKRGKMAKALNAIAEEEGHYANNSS